MRSVPGRNAQNDTVRLLDDERAGIFLLDDGGGRGQSRLDQSGDTQACFIGQAVLEVEVGLWSARLSMAVVVLLIPSLFEAFRCSEEYVPSRAGFRLRP